MRRTQIVWFQSDNGGVGNIWANNHPLRGSKLTVYEGIASPRQFVGQERSPPALKFTNFVGYIDLLPTLLAATGRRI